MDRKYCKVCAHTGFRATGNMWTGCNYLEDTGECRPFMGEWCLGFKYTPYLRNGKVGRRKDLTAEYERMTDKILGREPAANCPKKRGRPCTKSSAPEAHACMSPEDAFRIWLNLMT